MFAAWQLQERQKFYAMWEGLGYYRRARQLHAAAQQIVAEYGGQFPADASELQKLPGIGRYTAGAIASIAFDKRAPILEANTIRLLSRLIGFRGNPHSLSGQRPLWQRRRRAFAAKTGGRLQPGADGARLARLHAE